VNELPIRNDMIFFSIFPSGLIPEEVTDVSMIGTVKYRIWECINNEVGLLLGIRVE
jgi:hypothetical protein